MKRGLHGASRDVESSGDLLERQVLVEAQHYDCALLG